MVAVLVFSPMLISIGIVIGLVIADRWMYNFFLVRFKEEKRNMLELLEISGLKEESEDDNENGAP